MDIEQLKLILEQINTLGGNAQETFIWWLVVSKVPGIIFGICWTIIGAVTLVACFKLTRIFLAGTKLMEAAGVRICWSAAELAKAEKVLREHFK